MASGSVESLDQLPAALLAIIMTKLDISSICSLAVTCRTFNSCAFHILSFLPNFHILEISPSMGLMKPLLPPNPHLKSLKLECGLSVKVMITNEKGVEVYERSHLVSTILLVGTQSNPMPWKKSEQLKASLSLSFSHFSLPLPSTNELNLMFDLSLFLRHNFARVWALASEKLTSLEIVYISSVMVTELLSPNVGPRQYPDQIQPSVLPSIQKLSLAVDYITDTMHGRLKHLSLVWSQEFLSTYFKRVNDLGILLMAEKCANMESICLAGFCRVTDTGFKTLLHSCSSLYKLKVCHGSQLTDLVFHDIAATSLSLTHVSFRWCNLLTNHAIRSLVCNIGLKVLDLRGCKNLGDEALPAIGFIRELKMLQLDNSDITDVGIAYLRHGIISSLISLSVRGCKKLTDKSISVLFDGSSKLQLQELDLSNLPSLSDNGVLTLAKSRVPISELRMRQCPLIGDTSVMALASMQVGDERGHGSNLRLLDLYNCGGITQLSFRWLKKPYFPRLRWLGVMGSLNRDIVDALARNRPYLHVACHGEELGTDPWNNLNGSYMHDYEELDELEQWVQE
ncbi:F-box/RNI-like superfamily protein isoform 2 [Hibiscus syriacus]|uniref:F-box/RNI-like superfamily protein isoform 2 n=1 Tax=Hibiscus syriacus TaxID=106335 RepID=A0A6A2WJ28_HIBSY|nr:F-box/RNI-like superfamily protein isoform 2 [Hibiscus syriacus]